MRRLTGISLIFYLIISGALIHAETINIYRGTPAFTVGGGYIVPTGDYAHMADPGQIFLISCQYQPPAEFLDTFFWWSYFFFDISFQYASTTPSESPESSLTWYSADFGPVLYYPLSGWIYPYIGVSAGWHYSILDLDATDKQASNNSYLMRGKTGIIIPATSSLSFRIECGYNYFNLSPTPFTSYAVTLGASYNFSGDTGNRISPDEASVKLTSKTFDDIYAIRYKQYNSSGIGMLSITNTGDTPVYNVRIDVDIEGVTSVSRSTESIKLLPVHETRSTFIRVNITDKILSITEDGKRSIRFRIVYGTDKSKYYYTENSEIQVFNKNAITWDKTERLGSFIMPRDATLSSFSRRMISAVNEQESNGISTKLFTAMILFNSLNAAGLTYVSDPQTMGSGIDYVQLPGETLNKKAGDCDDLTALYASLLEGVGISTAIATIPGHVFLLFNTEVIESSTYEISDDPLSYVIRGGTVWVPVEVTSLKEGFFISWKNGSQNVARADFFCIDTMKAWEQFPPADNETDYAVETPDTRHLNELIASDTASLKNIMLDKKASQLNLYLSENSNDYKKWNELGIIYGRFNMLKEAEECFIKAVSLSNNYCSALCNLGNIAMLKKDYKTASDFYEKAYNIDSDNTGIIINFARALYELKKYDQANTLYRKALLKNPGVAARYGYLARSTADQTIKERASYSMDRGELNAWLNK